MGLHLVTMLHFLVDQIFRSKAPGVAPQENHLLQSGHLGSIIALTQLNEMTIFCVVHIYLVPPCTNIYVFK